MATPDPSATSGPGGAGNTRYAYLVARLRNRQITMEEATELFGIMQGMLRTSEVARQALQRAAVSAASAMPPERLPTSPAPVPAVPSTGGDDLFLVGLLAMGAGAGLLAAMTRKIQDMAPPSPPPGDGRPRTGATGR